MNYIEIPPPAPPPLDPPQFYPNPLLLWYISSVFAVIVLRAFFNYEEDFESANQFDEVHFHCKK